MSKKAKPKSDAEIYGKFLDFLRSAIWRMPIASFIEQRCLLFDRAQGDENMYQATHDEYKSLVDMLIACFCDDLSTTAMQVSQALRNAKTDKRRKGEEIRAMLEPVTAAQDFTLFVHMMTRKNIELQLEALQMIEFMNGIIPSALMPVAEMRNEAGALSHPDQAEHIIFIQIMKNSKAEYEAEMKARRTAEEQ